MKGASSSSSTRGLVGWAVGFGASILADQVFFLSLTWAALQVGTPADVGVVLAAGSIPRLVVLLVGGAFADRASPKRIIIGTDSGRALLMGVAALVLMLGSMNVWALVLLALAIGALDGLFLPAVGALPARIAPPHLMGRVAALRTVTQRVAMLVGGPLAGWLIYLFGASAAFWGSAALFALSVGSLALVRVAPLPEAIVDAAGPSSGPDSDTVGPKPGVVARITDGLRTVRRNPVLPWLLLLVAGMNFGFAGPVTAGLPLLAAHEQWGARGAGLLLGAFGLGAAVSGLGLVFAPRIPHAGRTALISVSVMGLALGAVGFTATLTAALAAAVVLGLASGVFGTVVHAMVLTSTPKAELGRVMGLLSLSVEGVVPVSFAATGLLAGLVSARATLTIGGVVILLSTLVALTRPQLRSFRLPQTPDAPTTDPQSDASTAEPTTELHDVQLEERDPTSSRR